MKSFGDVADVANLVVFLASDDAKYMTGSFVTVDGGAAAMLGTGAPL
jgi:3-oxoacyl-[acyl-carrier protein] reductase